MKYVQTFEEFTSGIKKEKVSDTHEVAQEKSVEKISTKGPETIEEPELTEKDIAANAQTEKDKAEMLKAIKEFNKEKNQDLNKLYNELLFHVGEPDTKKNVDKLNSYLLDNNLIKYTVSEDANSIQSVHQLFEGESIESRENVNEAADDKEDPSYLEWLSNKFKKNKDFMKIMKDTKLSNEEYKTIYYAIQDAVSGSHSISNSKNGW
jgi:uncharacterized membrane protein YheB (UPF0754 family)